MKTFALLALCLVAVAAQENCTGVISADFDQWCTASCNSDPRVCPSTFCACPSDNATAVVCNAVGAFEDFPGGDAWCRLNCNFEPSFCPEAFCQCGDPVVIPDPDFVTFEEFEPHCCEGEERVLFFSEAGAIWKMSQVSGPELCYEFDGGNPTSLRVDADNMLWVADPVLGTVMRMSTDCDNTTVTVVTSWIRDGVIDQPTALNFGDGGVLVSGSTNLYVILIEEVNGTVFAINEITDHNNTINFQITDIEVDAGIILLVTRNARVVAYIPTLGEFTVLDFHAFGVPDYGGITINDCGLFFTATDSNTVYYCPEVDLSACQVYCTGNETGLGHPTCINVNNPVGIASGCCCDIYVANAGNGMITKFDNDDLFTNPLSNDTVVGSMMMGNLTHPRAITFWNEPTVNSVAGCPHSCDSAP